MLVVLLNDDREMLYGSLQIAFVSCDLAQLVIGIYFVRVDFKSLIQMLQSARFLPAFEIDKPQLHMSVRIARIDRGVVQKTFKILPLAKCIAKTASLAAKKSAKVNEHPKQEERG